MAKLVTILTKNVWEDWNAVDLIQKTDDFTQIEYDKIVVPYLNYVKALPGINWEETQFIKSDTQLVTIRYFDTVENAQAAETKLSISSDAPEVQHMMILTKTKQSTQGYTYGREMRIIP